MGRLQPVAAPVDRVVGLPDLWMDATGDLGGHRAHALAIEIKPILLPVRCPTFLKTVCLLGRGDNESSKRQDGANTDVRRRARANMPAPRTRKNWNGCAVRIEFVEASRPDHRATRRFLRKTCLDAIGSATAQSVPEEANAVPSFSAPPSDFQIAVLHELERR
jgi:hypothetical protein